MKFTPVGAYKFFTDKQVAEQSWTRGNKKTEQQLSSVYLIELIAEEITTNLGCLTFCQTEDCACYSEDFLGFSTSQPIPKEEDDHILLNEGPDTWKVYLDDREREIASSDDLTSKPEHPTNGKPFRIVFFLHYFDPSAPLESPQGQLILPTPTKIPERLSWKEYVHWD
ncbi:MAG: hypothetical protein ACKVJU_02610 [Verrucomicrobiales bacterium]